MDLWKPFSDAFNGDKLLVFKTDHWSVLVRKHRLLLALLYWLQTVTLSVPQNSVMPN
jgi:hypothetical protein